MAGTYDTVTLIRTIGPFSLGMCKDASGNGVSELRIWLTGDPNYNVGGSNPTLLDITTSNMTFLKGSGRTEPLLHYTAPGTIACTGLPTGLTVDNVNHQLLWDGSTYAGGGGTGSIVPTETLAGATNTPHTSPAINYTINAAPAFTVNPSITGSVVQGSTLTAVDGTFSGFPAASVTARRWKRGSTTVGFSTTYASVLADVGSNIGLEVDISNGIGGTITGFATSVGPITAAGASPLSAPAIGYPSPLASNPTTIQVIIGVDWANGDILKLDRSASVNMSSPTTLSHTITDTDITNGTFSIGLSGVTLSGNTFFQAYGNHSAVDSTNKSNIVAWNDTTAPVITTSAAQANTEGTALAIALTATDTGGVGVASWSIVGGDDQLQYEISGTTLRWVSNGNKSFGSPNDFQLNNTYDVIVRATDYGGNFADLLITTTVSQADLNPDAFTFTDVTNATPTTVYTSNTITIAGVTAGVNCPCTCTGSGAEFSKNSGAWTAVASLTSVQLGDTIAVRGTCPGTGQLDIALTVGTTSDTYSIITPWTPNLLFTGGEFGYVFDPSDTSKFWQDDTASVAGAFASTIGRLDDMASGSSRHFSQATSGKRPTAVSPGWVQFDGVDDSLTAAISGLIASSGASIVMAIKGAAQTTKVFWGEGSTSTDNPGYRPGTQTHGSSGGHVIMFESDNSGGQNVNADFGIGNLLDGSGHIFTMVESTPSTRQANAWKDRVVGTLQTYTRTATTVNVSALGCLKRTTEAVFCAVSIGRAIFLNRALTSAERANAEAWCAAPYGITLP